VEGVHEDRARGLGVLVRSATRLVVRRPGHHELHVGAAEGDDPLALLAGSVARDVDPTPDAQAGARPGHALGVVAGGGADDAPGPLVGVERPDRVEGTADLVGPGDLPVLAL